MTRQTLGALRTGAYVGDNYAQDRIQEYMEGQIRNAGNTQTRMERALREGNRPVRATPLRPLHDDTTISAATRQSMMLNHARAQGRFSTQQTGMVQMEVTRRRTSAANSPLPTNDPQQQALQSFASDIVQITEPAEESGSESSEE